MRLTALDALAALACLSLAGCPDRESSRSMGTTAPASSGAAAALTSGAPTSTAAPQPARVELLALTMTSAVRDKDPVDRLQDARPGERVYAHLRVRNRTGKTQTLAASFTVNGEPRSTVPLAVEPSWSWRTWAYNTVLLTDRPGTLTVTITGEGGELAAARLPIVAKKR